MANQDLNKSEMVELICEYETLIDFFAAVRIAQRKIIAAKDEVIALLEAKVARLEDNPIVVEKPGRKDEVLALLIAHKKISIPMIAKLVGISERNVSSQLSYLRKDGHLIGADSRGWKVYEGKS